jgi:hypothetical protein
MDCSTGELSFPFNSDFCQTKIGQVGPSERMGAASAVTAAGGSAGLVISRISRQSGLSSVLTVYPVDAKERHPQRGVKRRGGGMRQAVTLLSESSKRRMVFTFRNVVGLEVFLHLTYPGKPELVPTDGREVKRHWDNMRRWLVRQGVAGGWFMEFQRRGAPHLHVFLTGPIPKEKVAAAWNRIAGQDDPDNLMAGIRIESMREKHMAAVYAAKYASKSEQKDVPEAFQNVGRFWGLFGGLSVEPVAEVNSQERLDTETGEIVAGGAVQAARVMRRLVNARRRAAGRRRFRDSGRQGFTGYGCGPAMLRYVEATRGIHCRPG